MQITKDSIRHQQGLEREMLEAGVQRYREAVVGARQAGAEDTTAYGVRLLRASIEPVAEAIKAALVEAKEGKPGRRHRALSYLNLLEADVIAFIAAKTVLSAISQETKLAALAVSVGRRLEDECRFRLVQERDPDLVRRLAKLTEKSTHYAHRRRVFSAIAGREGHAELDWWTEEDLLHIGMWLIDHMAATTGLIEIELRQSGRQQTTRYVRASEACAKWIAGCNEAHELLQPAYWPTLIPPRRWKGLYGGGYWSRLPRPLCLVKTRSADGFLTDLSNSDLSQVLEAVNTVQDTPYRIRRWVLERIEEARANGRSIKGLEMPPPEETKPPKPGDIETNEEARKAYRKAASAWYDEVTAKRSKALQTGMILSQVRRFADAERFYLPVQLDFRGRLYYLPLISPQGPKLVRGLLEAADPLPIETEEQAGWLMIHVANTFGFDKASYEERIGWVGEREARIIQAGTDPWADQWWTEADSPWEFLSACYEYAGLKAHGYGFPSRLIVSMDGTCNGLQHLSAMLLDERGGRAVNLLPRETPADIYGEVWAATRERLSAIAAGAGEDAAWARRWLDVGGDRKLVKRIVMCLPYGLGQFSARAYLLEATRERLAGRKDRPFAHIKEDGTETDGLFAAVNWLAPHVWNAIGDVVSAARQAMSWMQAWASAVAKGGLPVTWTTPDGLMVQQRYRKADMVNIRTTLLGGVQYRVALSKPTDEVDTRAQRNGVAPNFVHSLDAAAMREYVRVGAVNGIGVFALVHDSYGCRAAEVAMMQACLREAFCLIYEGTDVLARLREELLPLVPDDALPDLPELPAKGGLDLAKVRESAFFFA